MQFLKQSKLLFLMYVFVSVNILLSVTNIMYGINRINDNKNFLSSEYIQVTNGADFDIMEFLDTFKDSDDLLIELEPRYDIAAIYYNNYSFCPQIVEGRNFEKQDFAGDEKIALVSKDALKKCYDKDGRQFINFDNEDYMVVGIFEKADNQINPDSDIYININIKSRQTKTNEIFIDSKTKKEQIIAWCNENNYSSILRSPVVGIM